MPSKDAYRVHILLHEPFEAPAAIALWAEERGYGISATKFYAGEHLPKEIAAIDLLVVMGGPQAVTTTLAECPYFDAAKEINFIRRALDANKKALGVCLGAQLLGEAFSARAEQSPEREIGIFPINLTAAAQHDRACAHFPTSFAGGHWHGDMPGLTASTLVLATSAGCPRQIVCYSPHAYAFQCHLEFTPATIEGMIANNSAELERYQHLPYVARAESMRGYDYRAMNTLLTRFLDCFVDRA